MKSWFSLLLIVVALTTHTSVAFASRKPLAIFLNTHIHPEGVDRIVQLQPGLIRLFLGDWKSEKQVDRLISTIEALDSLDARILVQINLFEYPEETEFLAEVRSLASRLDGRVDYWQLGNESDSASRRYFPYAETDMVSFAKLLSSYSRAIKSISPGARTGVSVSTRVFEQKARTRMFETLVEAIHGNAKEDVQTIDIHWHREYADAEKLVDHIARVKSYFKGSEIEFLMTESNTYTQVARIRKQNGEVARELGFQSEEMQASYGIRSVLLGCAGGVSYTAFGYPVERESFGAKKAFSDHPFALNGLWYSEKKQYDRKQVFSGPKKSAFSYFLLSRLFSVAPVDQCIFVEEDGLFKVLVEGPAGNYMFVWSMRKEAYGAEREITLEVPEFAGTVYSIDTIVAEKEEWPPANLDSFHLEKINISPGAGTLNATVKEGKPLLLLNEEILRKLEESMR
ncbi:hypothetical protein ACUNV4_17885 [Granulosicoccus sp. 3-233]|uniref:hypothetical protein n=1 Tax=Granulosicoccus sp. 3-233 TaxID=3417969 RepID=UPI003D352F27